MTTFLIKFIIMSRSSIVIMDIHCAWLFLVLLVHVQLNGWIELTSFKKNARLLKYWIFFFKFICYSSFWFYLPWKFLLSCIALNQGFFMQKDYKMFPPSVNWDNINWSTRRPQMDFPIQVYLHFSLLMPNLFNSMPCIWSSFSIKTI